MGKRVRVNTPKPKPTRPLFDARKAVFDDSKIAFFGFVALGATVIGVFAANTSINIPNVEFGGGVVDVAQCTSSSVVDISQSVSGSVTEYSVSSVPSSCVGKWIRMSVYSSSGATGNPIDQVVWQLPSTSLTPFTLRANGTTTGQSGSTLWPALESGVSGMKSGVSALSGGEVRAIRFEVSGTSLLDNF